MTTQRGAFYAEDLVRLKSKPERIGVVERSHGDISTHYPDVLGRKVRRSANISPRDFAQFKTDGIPPRNAVLVTWVRQPWTLRPYSILIPETQLELIDRHCELGDRVKRKQTDAMSGTVIAIDIKASLLPPCNFPAPGRASALADARNTFGTFARLARDQLHHVNANELARADEFVEHDVVSYQGWIGQIIETDIAYAIRLSNGSVVVAEDEDDVKIAASPRQVPAIGDFVITKKANLRRGRWIYGAYDPNIEPCGYVVESITEGLVVDWKECRGDSSLAEPPVELSKDIIDSQGFRRCARYQRPCSQDSKEQPSPPVKVGDRLRFLDPITAAAKHGYRNVPLIPRSSTLGYDLNCFLCTATQTVVRVQWQDLSESIHLTAELVPTLDWDDEDDVWPGEIVATKDDREQIHNSRLPRKTGVVQTVDARNRTAVIKWFQGEASWAKDDSTFVFPGTWTGSASEQTEIVSLYDIMAAGPLTRIPGDLVVIKPFHRAASIPPDTSSLYREVEYIAASESDLKWIGDVISATLDGRILVRLMSEEEVLLPAECTVPIGEDPLDDMDDELDDFYDLDEWGNIGSALPSMNHPSDLMRHLAESLAHGPSDGRSYDFFHEPPWEEHDVLQEERPWTDGNNEPVEDDEDWQTDDDEEASAPGDAEMADDSVETAESVAGDPEPTLALEDPRETAENSSLAEHVSLRNNVFSYTKMCAKLTIEKVKVLEGELPVDHHFAKAHGSTNTQAGSARFLGQIRKQIKYLQEGLPDGVYVRSWESGMQYWRFLLLGPIDTPYEYAPFLIDMYLPPTWPNEAPKLFFHSYTDGTSPINPNLYEDGTICLSLLGTWSGESSETWTKNSTLLQIIVSILGLILVPEPYFNEAGFEVRRGTSEAELPSRQYTERVYFRSRRFLNDALDRSQRGVGGRGAFEAILEELYDTVDDSGGKPMLLIRAIWSAIVVLHRSTMGHADPEQTAPGRHISVGAAHPLRRHIEQMIACVTCTSREPLQAFLNDSTAVPSGGPHAIYDELRSYA